MEFVVDAARTFLGLSDQSTIANDVKKYTNGTDFEFLAKPDGHQWVRDIMKFCNYATGTACIEFILDKNLAEKDEIEECKKLCEKDRRFDILKVLQRTNSSETERTSIQPLDSKAIITINEESTIANESSLQTVPFGESSLLLGESSPESLSLDGYSTGISAVTTVTPLTSTSLTTALTTTVPFGESSLLLGESSPESLSLDGYSTGISAVTTVTPLTSTSLTTALTTTVPFGESSLLLGESSALFSESSAPFSEPFMTTSTLTTTTRFEPVTRVPESNIAIEWVVPLILSVIFTLTIIILQIVRRRMQRKRNVVLVI
jgi:hypothetical protein